MEGITKQIKSRPIIIAIVVVFVLILVYLRAMSLEADIVGVWVAPADFLHEAELTNMMIVIGAADRFSSCHNCIIDVGEIQEFKMWVRPYGMRKRTHAFAVKLEFEQIDLMPLSLQMEYNAFENRIVLHDDSTTYAVLFKSPELTYIANRSHDSSSSDDE